MADTLPTRLRWRGRLHRVRHSRIRPDHADPKDCPSRASAAAVSDTDEQGPKLTAANEGAIAAVYAAVVEMVLWEIDIESDLEKRGQSTRDAGESCCSPSPEQRDRHSALCRPPRTAMRADGNACAIPSECGGCGTSTPWTPTACSTLLPTPPGVIAENRESSRTISSPPPRTPRSQRYRPSGKGGGELCEDS